MRSVVAVSLLGLAATACIKLPTNDPVALCIEQGKIECAFAYNCCEVDERARFGGIGVFTASRNEGECNDNVGHFCEALGSSAQISVERGRLQIDGAKAQACLDARRAAQQSCDLEELRQQNDDCDETTLGLVEDGDACTSDSECADGGRCEVARDDDGEPKDVDPETGVAEGECAEPGSAGDDCDFDDDCKEGLFCNFEDNKCKELPGEGDACPDFECADGFDCQFDDGAGEEICVEAEPAPAPDDNDEFDFCKG